MSVPARNHLTIASLTASPRPRATLVSRIEFEKEESARLKRLGEVKAAVRSLERLPRRQGVQRIASQPCSKPVSQPPPSWPSSGLTTCSDSVKQAQASPRLPASAASAAGEVAGASNRSSPSLVALTSPRCEEARRVLGHVRSSEVKALRTELQGWYFADRGDIPKDVCGTNKNLHVQQRPPPTPQRRRSNGTMSERASPSVPSALTQDIVSGIATTVADNGAAVRTEEACGTLGVVIAAADNDAALCCEYALQACDFDAVDAAVDALSSEEALREEILRLGDGHVATQALEKATRTDSDANSLASLEMSPAEPAPLLTNACHDAAGNASLGISVDLPSNVDVIRDPLVEHNVATSLDVRVTADVACAGNSQALAALAAASIADTSAANLGVSASRLSHDATYDEDFEEDDAYEDDFEGDETTVLTANGDD